MLPIVASVAGYELTDAEKYWLEKNQPVGVSFFDNNIQNKRQFKKLLNQIKEVTGNEKLLLYVDQEGGQVCRLVGRDFKTYAPQQRLGEISPKATRLHAGLISADFKELGLNMNCAPVLDILHSDTASVIGSRSFGNDKKLVAALGKEMMSTFIKNGVCPIMKHIPGHGAAVEDSHLGLPVISKNLDELETDFYPFIINRNIPAAMTAHILIEAVDDKKPITISKKGIDTLIRGHIGFDGLLISDAMEMNALKGTIGQRTRQVLEAGCDLALYCSGDINELNDMAANCLPMSDKTAERLERVYQIIQKPPAKENCDYAEYLALAGELKAYSKHEDMTMIMENMNQHKI
ncbi:MAG: glycoside hydrolase family 3 protein [Alphaproteobacteria bacterium]|nr:glycoside hydrolase family 3 protein [Alphaproteobacteria bacterium]